MRRIVMEGNTRSTKNHLAWAIVLCIALVAIALSATRALSLLPLIRNGDIRATDLTIWIVLALLGLCVAAFAGVKALSRTTWRNG